MILFRKCVDPDEELVAKKYFDVINYRSEIQPNRIIIPRYSSLPFYHELEQDVMNLGSRLINSYRQHQWITNLDYYEILKDYTFRTWFSLEEINHLDIPMIVKGKINSKKHTWNRTMYAKNRDEARSIYFGLLDDSLIGNQTIIFREYVPLKTYGKGLYDLPFTNEWRFFFYQEELVSYGYYWANSDFDGEMNEEGIEFAKNLAKICSEYVGFYVLDIAQKEDGNWILVEINDGTMSGLSRIDPDQFYSRLKAIF